MFISNQRTHAWMRDPYYGGCGYYCTECGVRVECDYEPGMTGTSSGAESMLDDLMDEANKEVACSEK